MKYATPCAVVRPMENTKEPAADLWDTKLDGEGVTLYVRIEVGHVPGRGSYADPIMVAAVVHDGDAFAEQYGTDLTPEDYFATSEGERELRQMTGTEL